MHNSASAYPASRVGRKVAIAAAVLAGVALTVGAVAQNAATGGFHQGSHHGTQMGNASPEDVATATSTNCCSTSMPKPVPRLCATGADRSAQRRATATDLLQLHGQFHSELALMLWLLTADTIDRAAIENARAAQLNVLDQASKELVQLLADTAGVLTPAQRKALAERLAAHLGVGQG